MLLKSYDDLRCWLFSDVLPLWSSSGTDYVGGGFFEKLSKNGDPIENLPRRTRVVARQIYSFATAGRIGWTGDWEKVFNHGCNAFFSSCIKPDGLVVSTYSHSPEQANPNFDLYDHAFALFSLSEIGKIEGFESKASALAVNMFAEMNLRFKAPQGGWFDSETQRSVFRSNPHMHMLEALLSLYETFGDDHWLQASDQIVELAMKYFINPRNNALHEYFGSQWQVHEGSLGEVIEPGHQFEWYWLLYRWSRLTRCDFESVCSAATELFEIGERYGVTDKHFVIEELFADYRPKIVSARTWPHTERLKACLMRASIATCPSDVAIYESKAASAINSILSFRRDDGVQGLWFDRISAAGEFLDEDCPASTLYHIMCAMEEATRYMKRVYLI